MKKRTIIFVLFMLISGTSVFAQFESRGKEYNFTDAEHFFKAGDYYDALPLYEKLAKEYPDEYDYKMKMGICHLHLTNTAEKAVTLLQEVYHKKPKMNDIEFYLARAYALNYRFDDAIVLFQKAEKNAKTSLTNKKRIPLLIKQCNNAKQLVKDSIEVEIVNLGDPINSPDNEYSPTINADESVLIYTYRGSKSTGGRQDEFNREIINGSFYEDVFISLKKDNTWSEPVLIGENINTFFHEGSISLSPDGQRLYVYRDTKDFSGDIFEVEKVDGKWMEPKWLAINSESWEGHAAISPNGKFMIFSSDRPGGIGEKDLYSAVLQQDGTWGEIKNLGPTINTPYNDDAPFIHSDGVTFNFCSEGHSSMGGYDIFESKILDEGFDQPRNIGYPINTTSDDIFFYVAGRGHAYYSSARKGGLGQQDIYVINVNDVISSKPVLLVKGIVTTNGKFEKAKISVRTESGSDLGTYHTDVSDGKYQFYVDLDDYYVISYEVDGFPAQIVTIDATQYKEYTEIEKNINFSTKDMSIDGVALLKENPYSPIINLKVNLTNEDKSFNEFLYTDSLGRYNFENLPNDDYYLLFLNENDEKLIQDSTYIFKGTVSMKGLPYTEATINDMPTDDQGNYRIEVKNKFYGLLKGTETNLSEMSAEDIVEKYGDQTAPGLVFVVQVAAYSNASNYDSSHLKGLGPINKTLLDDGVTRFTMGLFTTLRQAKALQQKAIERGQTDAFVLMMIDGKRTYLEDLIKDGVFK